MTGTQPGQSTSPDPEIADLRAKFDTVFQHYATTTDLANLRTELGKEIAEKETGIYKLAITILGGTVGGLVLAIVGLAIALVAD